jgi:hypothetical protein
MELAHKAARDLPSNGFPCRWLSLRADSFAPQHHGTIAKQLQLQRAGSKRPAEDVQDDDDDCVVVEDRGRSQWTRKSGKRAITDFFKKD